MISEAYNKSEYYEIALSSWRNVRVEVGFLDKVAKNYLKVKVNSMIEIGRGNSPYIEEI